MSYISATVGARQLRGRAEIVSYEDQQLIGEFTTEANEHLAEIESQLLAIEAQGAEIDLDLVNTLFRGVHSIKGAAGFLGLHRINDLSHSLEDVLNQIRNRRIVPNSENVDVMLRAADLLRTMVADVATSHKTLIEPLVEQLSAISEGRTIPQLEVTPSIATKQSQPKTSAEPESRAEFPLAIPLDAQDPPPLEPAGSPEIKPVPSEKPGSKVAEQNIRVPVGVLDELMNLAGELVLSRNQLVRKVATDEDHELQSMVARLDQVTAELQETIMRTRMQPLGTVFQKFTRVVRDLGTKLGKQVELRIEGHDVEVDKTIIEAIADPLTHLIRNAIDHGIETPDRRAAAKKPTSGEIRLVAYHQAGKVRIDLTDDGKGIDPAILRRKGIEKGILTEEEAARLPDREATRLIFHPGFSTAEQLTDVSGRGVGMDVVQSNIQRLGGSVDITSTVGRGTCIQLTLPLTLAIVPALVVEAAGSRYVVPQGNIAELVRVRHEDRARAMPKIHGQEMLRLRGGLLPLVGLGRLMGSTDPPATQGNANRRILATSILVVESGNFRFGLVVDRFLDSEEIVVKSLGRHLRQCEAFSGATVLGNGDVAMILDPAGVALLAGLGRDELPEAELDAAACESAERISADSQTLLLFTCGEGDRFAVPMALVHRVERIRACQIQTVGDREVLSYRSSTLPLVRLEQAIPTAPIMPDRSGLFAIVFQVGGREVGLLVSQVEDIRDVPNVVDTATFRQAGVIGSVVIGSHTTRLIDLYGLVESVSPVWLHKQNEPDTLDGRGAKVLLAEDSDFYRQQVTSYLEKANFQVTAVCDGTQAWQALGEADPPFDILLTDLEMPKLGGLELARRVRQQPALENMPIVALTSLASEDDRAHGVAAGVTDYLVKMDREQLIRTLVRRLPASRPVQRSGVGEFA